MAREVKPGGRPRKWPAATEATRRRAVSPYSCQREPALLTPTPLASRTERHRVCSLRLSRVCMVGMPTNSRGQNYWIGGRVLPMGAAHVL